jgi:flagellar export protein FliJ
MRRFVFPLESVLKLRRAKEDAARRSYVHASQQRQEHEQKLAALGQLRGRVASQLLAVASRGETLLLSYIGARLQQLDRDVREGEDKLGQLRQVEAENHNRLLAVAREHGVVQRLRDRQAEAFKIEQQRAGMTRDDEMATLRFSRRSAGINGRERRA